LANEQVVGGMCWRHENTPVEQRELEQWFLRITKYADELLRDLAKLSGWPEKVRIMQENWIGRSEGTLVDFDLGGTVGPAGSTITVFTRRYARNPYNGEAVPVWVANYILMDYGTGAIMSVPAHDERDYEFAKKYDLDIRVVIMPRREGDAPNGDPANPVLPFTETNSLVINSGEFDGMPSQEAIQKMSKYAEKNGFGKATITYRLKDWGISRQRYWGTPIPVIYCPTCGIVPVPEKDLPVLLPENVNITLAGGSPLGQVPEFVNVSCPKCGGAARRETDTMDTFVDSSWYFYRYTNPALDTRPLDSD